MSGGPKFAPHTDVSPLLLCGRRKLPGRFRPFPAARLLRAHRGRKGGHLGFPKPDSRSINLGRARKNVRTPDSAHDRPYERARRACEQAKLFDQEQGPRGVNHGA